MHKDYPTPRSDSLDRLRIELQQERTTAYGDALALCRQLEKELATVNRKLDRVMDELNVFRYNNPKY